jgi:hypothetical protein
VSGVRLGGRESDLTIPECGLAIMSLRPLSAGHRSVIRFALASVSRSRRASPVRRFRVRGCAFVCAEFPTLVNA